MFSRLFSSSILRRRGPVIIKLPVTKSRLKENQREASSMVKERKAFCTSEFSFKAFKHLFYTGCSSCETCCYDDDRCNNNNMVMALGENNPMIEEANFKQGVAAFEFGAEVAWAVKHLCI